MGPQGPLARSQKVPIPLFAIAHTAASLDSRRSTETGLPCTAASRIPQNRLVTQLSNLTTK